MAGTFPQTTYLQPLDPHTHPTPSCQRREVQALQAQIAKLKRAAKQPAYERRASDIAEFARVKQELGAKVGAGVDKQAGHAVPADPLDQDGAAQAPVPGLVRVARAPA